MEPVYLSATQISNFKTCPRLWAWDKIAKIPRPPAQSLELGSRVHDILEAFYQKQTPPPRDEKWRFEVGKPIFMPGRIASGMISAAIPVKAVPILKAEMAFEDRTLGAEHGIIYKGKIDIHWIKNRTLFIVDHKTSSDPEKWGKKREDLDSDTQSILYSAVGLSLYPDTQKINFALNYGSTQLRYRKNYFVDHTVTRDENAAAYAALIEPYAVEMAEHKRNETNPLELPANPEACGLYGGCPNKQRCNLTTRERIRGLMNADKPRTKLQEILDAKRKQTETEDKVNPPEAETTQASNIEPETETAPTPEPETEPTPEPEAKPKKGRTKRKVEPEPAPEPTPEVKVEPVPARQTLSICAKSDEMTQIFQDIDTLVGIAIGGCKGEIRTTEYIKDLRDNVKEFVLR